MTSPLENLCGTSGPLHKEEPDPAEFAAFCVAALRRLGYRAANRYVVFQVLPHTLGLGPEVWRILDKCHKLRNQSEYEGDLEIDGRVVADLISACDAVAVALRRVAGG